MRAPLSSTMLHTCQMSGFEEATSKTFSVFVHVLSNQNQDEVCWCLLLLLGPQRLECLRYVQDGNQLSMKFLVLPKIYDDTHIYNYS